MIFRPKAPKPLSPEAQTRLTRIKAGGTAAERDTNLGPAKATDKKGGQRPGENQQNKKRPFGREK